MNNVLLQQAIKLNNERKRRNRRRRAMQLLSVFVVFCTAYSLVLPALTMEREPVCGYEVHTHAEACYTEQTVRSLHCPDVDAEAIVHKHDTLCYDADGALLCTLEEKEEHAHDDSCYTVEQTLTCAEEHEHADACYTAGEAKLTCDKEELALHSHGEECWLVSEDPAVAPELICTTPVVVEHVHEDACVVEETVNALTCTVEEHAHVDRCYPIAENLAAPELSEENLAAPEQSGESLDDEVVGIGRMICGRDEHSHGDACWQYSEDPNVPPVLTCAIFEHSHSAVCYFGGVTPTPAPTPEATPEPTPAPTPEVTPAPTEEPAVTPAPTVEEEQPAFGLEMTCTAEEHTHGDACFTEGSTDPVCGKSEHTHALKECCAPAKADYTYEDDFVSMTVHVVSWMPLSEGLTMKVTALDADNEAYTSYEEYALENSAGDLLGLNGYAITFTNGVTTVTLPEADITVDLTVKPVQYEQPAAFSLRTMLTETEQKTTDPETGVIVTVLQDGTGGVTSEGNVLYSEGAEQPGSMTFALGSSRTLALAAARAITAYRQVSVNGLDTSGSTEYVVYTQHTNGKYYAFDGNGNAVEITVNADGTITCDDGDILLWTFTAEGDQYIIRNAQTNGRYMHAHSTGVTTSGRWSSYVVPLVENGKMVFRVRSNSDYARLNNNATAFERTTNESQAAKYYLAARIDSANTCHVWFDGTDGGLMGLHGAGNTYQAVRAGTTITLPSDAWNDANAPTKYPYKLDGWYDINSYTYYKPGDQVTIYQNTVFYADWVAASYDVGVNNEHVVNTVDTNDFITTRVFDYTALFNVQSVYHTGTISASSHTETWTILNTGKVPYKQANTLGFMFVDYDANGEISYANGRDTTNINQGDAITAGIVAEVATASGGKDLMDVLFDETVSVIGKKYIGTGNHLFQYMDSTTSNYDGIHDGYYYLDARLNAASYNQSQSRFYLYDYLERTSDSRKDGGSGEYSDLLPFNSPYQFMADQLDNYVDPILRPGYEYDAKDSYTQNGITYSSYDDAGTNYWFGIRSDIRFFLPNDCGEAGKDQYDNYGNISTRGEHMIFDFHGDDDVWVYVDGELVLDIGGLHGVMFGQIDFSTGTVISGKDGGTTTTRTFEEILGHNIEEGEHTLTVYYMERGSSQSNCAIYFNIAPRYDLEITKEDIFTSEKLNGAEFSIFNDEACTDPAELWTSEQAYINGEASTHVFQVVDGKASCWGIAAGKTYYIKETKPPQVYDPPYPVVDDILRVTLNNRGTATIETTRLNGADGIESEGYAVIEQDVNNTLKIVSLTVTNQRDMDTTELRVKKIWDPNATDLPNSLTVYLTANGQRVGRAAVLTEANGWTYVWSGLPKYEADGVTPINYEVEEVQVSGFATGSTVHTNVQDYIEWTKSDAMADSSTYLLVNSERALAYNGSAFYWMDLAAAKDDTTGKPAQWYVTTNQYGFRLTNGNNYSLTYNYNANTSRDNFNAVQSTDISLNQVIYYLDNRLVAHSHDKYFQLGLNGDAVDSDGLVFTLYRRDVVNGHVVELENTLVDNDKQTFVEATKIWEDELDHSADSVTVHLYANGKDTGRTLILRAANSWFGIFEGLPYYDENGDKIVYTLVEDEPEDYDVRYEISERPGRTIVTWVKATAFEQNQNYRIFTGAKALELGSDNALAIGVNDADNTRQWWVPQTYAGRTILKSYAGNYYLYSDGSSVAVTTSRNNASAVTISGEDILVGDKYLVMTSSSLSVSTSEFNATAFTISRRTEAEGQPGLAIKVINYDEVEYILPETGGPGTQLYQFSGMLLIAAGLIYGYMLRRRREGRRET